MNLAGSSSKPLIIRCKLISGLLTDNEISPKKKVNVRIVPREKRGTYFFSSIVKFEETQKEKKEEHSNATFFFYALRLPVGVYV